MSGAVSIEQLSLLMDYMEAHPELAQGMAGINKEGRVAGNKLWEDCALLLNRVNPDCFQKTTVQWRMYYNEYKSKLLKKVRIQNGRIASGERLAATATLSPLQERLYTILGRDSGVPAPRLCVDTIIIKEEQENSNVNEDVIVEDIESDTQFELQGVGCKENNDQQERAYENDVLKNRATKPLKRKHKVDSSELSQDSDDEGTMRKEKSNADAILVQAAAIRKLARAIEFLAAKLPGSPPSYRRRRSSSSESDN